VNRTELEMVEILKGLAGDFGTVSVKAEFEAEGTRDDELLRLIDIAGAAGLPLTLKIGGCEALRDLYQAKTFGARYVVAPMIETAYALSKYVGAIDLAYDPQERESSDFLFNVETETGFNSLDEMIAGLENVSSIAGIVFGRVDFLGSLGLPRSDIMAEEVTAVALEISDKARLANLDLVVGGGVSSDSLPALVRIQEVHLTRFETRKVVFDGRAVKIPAIASGLISAVKFELLWLRNKREYYARAAKEDDSRIEMLEKRWAGMGTKN